MDLTLPGWSARLERHLGLLQMVDATVDDHTTPPSAWEYAIRVGDTWLGNRHGHEIPLGVRRHGQQLRRRSLLWNRGPAADVVTVYRPTPEGLEISHVMRWHRSLAFRLYYPAMFPVPAGIDPDRIVLDAQWPVELVERDGWWKWYARRPKGTLARGDVHRHRALYRLR